jgi:hypothetical protein
VGIGPISHEHFVEIGAFRFRGPEKFGRDGPQSGLLLRSRHKNSATSNATSASNTTAISTNAFGLREG